MDPVKFYLEDLKKKSKGYRPTWLPAVRLSVGDYGVLEKDVFSREGNIYTDFKIEVKPKPGEKSPSLNFSSEKGVALTTKIKGKVEPKAELLGEADAGFIVEFSKGSGYICNLKEYSVTLIENLGKIKTEVLQRFNEGKWDENHVIISQVITADSSTILVSGQSSTKLEFKANADVKVADMDIADAKMKLQYLSGKTIAVNEAGREGTTPLYRAIGIDKKFLRAAKVSNRGDGPEDQDPFIEV